MLMGGATVQSIRQGSKVVLGSHYSGRNDPKSMLRDVLGDNCIELEVFPQAAFSYDRWDNQHRYSHMDVGAIALRSVKKDVFLAIDSTSKGHSHLYIEKAFSTSDHAVLLQELGAIGVISSGWLQMAEREGMGVVRTPWTQKEFKEMPS